MKSLLNKIQNSKGCILSPPKGVPKVKDPYVLPADMMEFYKLCGGIKFFEGSDYEIEIVSPEKVQLSNPVILPEEWKTDIASDDISNGWYIIAEAGPEQRVSIDLNRKRLGKCYDSFWDIHASPGECPVIAKSFTVLIEKIFNANGGYWFWLSDDFESLGDAYG